MDISIWYGDRQKFGHWGNTQRLVNVVGSVSDPDEVIWIRYHLNGKPQGDLCIGPDQRRLLSGGDFNVEIDTSKLVDGKNELEIHVLDTAGGLTKKTVLLDYTIGAAWPLPYRVNWAQVENINTVAQVLDGRWKIVNGELRCIEPGYDRLVGIGDRTGWVDYEISVPITMHAIRPTGMRFPSCGHWAGLVLRWQGHYDWSTDQPLRGWFPLGAICGYIWKTNLNRRVLAMIGNNDQVIAMDMSGRQLDLRKPYWYKVRVQSQPGGPSRYAMKVWDVQEEEPFAWDMEGTGIQGELPCGSILLGAHQCEASFGDLRVVKI
jgi:hypothetical protein